MKSVQLASLACELNIKFATASKIGPCSCAGRIHPSTAKDLLVGPPPLCLSKSIEQCSYMCGAYSPNNFSFCRLPLYVMKRLTAARLINNTSVAHTYWPDPIQKYTGGNCRRYTVVYTLVLHNMCNRNCLWSVFIYSSFAVLVIVGGQSTTDDQRDNVDQLIDIVVRQQTELTKAVNEIEKLKEKVGQLEAQLSTNRPHNRKSHFYTLLGNIVFNARRYCKTRHFLRLQLCLSVCLSQPWHALWQAINNKLLSKAITNSPFQLFRQL